MYRATVIRGENFTSLRSGKIAPMFTVFSALGRVFFVAIAILGVSIIAVDLEDAQKWLNEQLGVSMTQREYGLLFFLIAALGLFIQAQFNVFRIQRQIPRLKLDVLPDDGSGNEYIQVTCSRSKARIEAIVVAENREEFDMWPHGVVYAEWDGLSGRYADVNSGGRAVIRLAEFISTAPSSIGTGFAHWDIPLVNPDGSKSVARSYSWIPGAPEDPPEHTLRVELVTDPSLARTPMIRRIILTANGISLEPNLGIRVFRRVLAIGACLGRSETES
jgi:hypothetical protein